MGAPGAAPPPASAPTPPSCAPGSRPRGTGLRAGYADELARNGAPFAVDDRVVRALEADKAVDELLYAVRFLPSWLDVARAALREFPADARP